MNEKRFTGDIGKLRSAERRDRLQPEKVIAYALAGIDARSVLDIGTGTGLFAEMFLANGLSVKGVDCNNEFIKVAQDLLPDIDFKVAVAEKLPFDKGQFDLAFMGHLLHETDDPALAVKEAYRVCRKRLAILEWPYVEQEVGPPLDHRMPLETIRQLGQAAGFSQCDVIQLRLMQLVIFDR